MKKILFVAASLRVGGMERVLVDLSNELVNQNYDVTIITYEESNGQNLKADLDKKVHMIYRRPKEFKIRKKLPYIHRFYKKDLWETRVSAEKLYKYYVGEKIKYDVEIAFCRGPAVKIISGSTNRNSIKLTWVHNDYKLLRMGSIAKFFKDLNEAKKAYNVFDKIVAVSEQARVNFVDIIGYEEKTTTIYNMLSIKDIQRKMNEKCLLDKEKFTVISVARLIPAKGFATLIRAAKKLNDKGFDYNLWIVGTGYSDEHEKELRQYIEDNNLKNVSLLGTQMNPYSFMGQADVYICSSWREGFSISVAEAMACGLPVISTNCTGPTEILDNGKYGILINYDEDEMFSALKNVILHPEILEEYRTKSAERCRRFSGEVIVKEIEALFD